MNRRRLLRLGLLLAVLVPACTTVEEDASLTLEVLPALLGSSNTHAPTVESGHRLIRVRRTLSLPADCREIDGAIARAAGEVTLRIVPLSDQGECAGAEVSVPYTATIDGLRPGRYNLRVVHTRTGGPVDVVLEHPVVVVSER